MARGGKRPNQTGRPKGSFEEHTIRRKEQLRAFREMVWKEQDELTRVQLDMAKGLQVMLAKTADGWKLVEDAKTVRLLVETDPQAKTWKIVTEKPDANSLNWALNRALGTPAQAIELSGPDGGEVVSKVIHEHLK